MDSITRNWNTDENYWLLNPVMKTIKVFNELYKKDKSKGKAQSSKLMWAIALYADTNEENPWRNLPEKEKKDLIAADYLNDSDFNWEHPDIVEFISTYEKYCLSVAERHLKDLKNKALERGAFIKKVPYSLDSYEDGKVLKGTASQLDTMIVNSIKLFQQLEAIEAQIYKENAEGVGRGGATESASEKGLI
jgi:hypothetical protein